MIKTTMRSYCKKCDLPVYLFEEIVTKFLRKYYCHVCGAVVRTVKSDEDK